MYGGVTIVTAIITLVCGSLLCQVATAQECSLLTTCTQCISRNASCGWCNNKDVFDRVSMDQRRQLLSATLCGTMKELDQLGCPLESIINPQGNVTEVTDGLVGSGVTQELPVLPSGVSVVARPGITQSFMVKVQPPSFISVDMYILMDLSFTMYDDLTNLRQFADELIEQMRNLTDEFRVAFGTFVEKPVSPFVDRIGNYSCAPDYELPGGNICVPTYSFLHRLNFTDDANLFKRELSLARPSGAISRPHSLLDGMLQVAVCANEMGWRSEDQARRLILVLTDDDYHIALDGKIAGLRNQPDSQCRIDPSTGYYEYAREVDYPGSAYIADILNERRIIPIFAVERKTAGVYNQLSEIIRSAFVGELASSATNLLDLISTQYRRLSTTVVPLISGLSQLTEITVTATPINDCTAGTLLNGTDDTCVGVIFPNVVEYNVSVSLSYDYCRTSDESTIHQLELLYIGFGDAKINITGLCSCDCEANKVANSSNCSGVGTYECSTCICPSSSRGPQCACPVEAISRATGCIPDGGNSSQLCNGRGNCICDECYCDAIPDLRGQEYQGSYCECDPYACPSGVDENGDVVPCAGHGVCGCDTQCICDPGFTGINCECTNATDTCINERTGALCSDVGTCQCGTCVCNDYSIRYGTYCQECGVCARSCSLLANCIRCYINGECDTSTSCTNINITKSIEAIPSYDVTFFRDCSISERSCEVVYQLDQYLLGSENKIFIYIDETQPGFINWRSGCDTPSIAEWLIPLVITIIIIVVAIVVLALWKGISYLIEYLEYRQWKKSQEDELWNGTTDNPLFVEPVSSYINPKYRARPVNVQQQQ